MGKHRLFVLFALVVASLLVLRATEKADIVKESTMQMLGFCARETIFCLTGWPAAAAPSVWEGVALTELREGLRQTSTEEFDLHGELFTEPAARMWAVTGVYPARVVPGARRRALPPATGGYANCHSVWEGRHVLLADCP